MTAPRMLICEDSRTYAVALKRMLEHDGDIAVVGVFTTAEEAIAALPRLEPDLVTMDIELPGMGGLQAVEEIMSSRPVPILVLSAHVGRTGNHAAAALAAGALDALAKDDIDLREPSGAAAAAFRRRVKLLSRARVIRHPRVRLPPRPAPAPAAAAAGSPAPAPAAAGSPATGRLDRRASVIGVCASTGGPHVLARLLGTLPAAYPVPILVVQHMATGFTQGLARWLDGAVPPPVRIAVAGARADRGVWIAPENTHLTFTGTGHLSIDHRTAAGPHRPSGDMLFTSIAAAAGNSGVALVLSGLGSDGAAGSAAVKRSGGIVIAQDQESSAVYGMPQAAIDRGVSLILAPDEIAGFLLSLRREHLLGAQ